MLKPPETEEIINQVLNRPAAFLVVKCFYRLKRSPNFVTLFSLIFGVSSGYFFARGSGNSLIIGGLLLEMMIIFDCADGQLARLTGSSSEFGKTLDGLADMATHFSIFYCTALALFRQSGNSFPFFLAVLAQLSMYLHIMVFDHFKNFFISATKPDYSDRLESVEALKQRVSRSRDEGEGLIPFVSAKLYYLFYKLEHFVVSIGYPPEAEEISDIFVHPERFDPGMREIYYNRMKSVVKGWSFIGDTMHLSLFILFGFLNRVVFIFPVIIGLNGVMVLLVVIQRCAFRSLVREYEEGRIMLTS